MLHPLIMCCMYPSSVVKSAMQKAQNSYKICDTNGTSYVNSDTGGKKSVFPVWIRTDPY